jgi:ADP-heptose:LPS heptosyltransferase
LIDCGLKVIERPTLLRTQQKNAERERDRFCRRRPPAGIRTVSVGYPVQRVNALGSILAAMCAHTGCDYRQADFRLPIPPGWHARAAALIAQWRPSKPIMIYRPLVDRTEWGGCSARNPDADHYAELFDAISSKFFVVSVADLVPGREWISGRARVADVELHRGELDFETMAALFARAALIFAAPGFAVLLAQAVEVPSVCVYGGFEHPRSNAGGARFAPYLPIVPINPCACWRHGHACNKRIDMPRALHALKEFADGAADRPAIVA